MEDIIFKNQAKKSNRRLLGSEMSKLGDKFARVARIVFSLAVIGALILNSAYFSFLPKHSAKAATTVFTETFSTTTYRDAPSTDANWDTAAGNAKDRTYTSLGWGKMDLTSGTDNLSNTSGNSNDVQFTLDSNNRSFVVWDDAATGAGDIYFSKWSGSAWVKADGTAGYDNVSNNAGASYSPKIQLDSSGKPNISWTDETTGSGDIYFTKWSGSAWVKADGTAGYDNVSNNALIPYLSYLLLDSTGKPQIVWDDNYDGATTGDIYFSKWSGSAWVKADGTVGYDNISNNAGVSLTSDFKLYSDNPYILWWDDAAYAGGGMVFSKWNGTNWVKADGATTGYDNFSSLSSSTGSGGNFQISAGNPYVAWLGWDGSDNEIFFTKWSGAAWVKADGTAGYDNISNNSGTAGVPLIKFDSSNNPYLVWDDSTTGTNDIYFSKWSGAAWVKADGTAGYDNISNNAGTSTYPQFQINSNNQPNVVWYDNTGGNYDVYFSKWNGTNWTLADGTTTGYDNVSNNSGTSYSSQFQLDSSGRAQIIWEDNTVGNYEIYSKKWNTGAYYSGSTAQSLKINGAINNITKATLTATQTLNSQTVSYEMTNNGGTSWNSVTSGSEYTFSAAGNDLRWRATILTNNDTQSPVVDTVAISYVSNNAPNAPALNSPANSATEISLTPPLQTTATDPDTDDVQYKIELTASGTFPSWTKADETTLGYDNLSNNAGSSGYPEYFQFRIDSTNKPHVVWTDGTTGGGDIYFSKWSGAAWVKADGTTAGYDNLSNNAGGSYSPQIQIDSTNKPFVVWEDWTTGSSDIYFSKWSGAAWVKADGATAGYDNISDNAGYSAFPQIQLDSTGKPNVVWYDSTGGSYDIRFSKWNGSNWTRADGTTLGYDNVLTLAGTSDYPEFRLDSSDRPYIVWQDSATGSGDIYFSKWSGAAWVKADGTAGYDNVSNNAYGSNSPQILLDSSDTINIVWQNTTSGNPEVYFSKWNGTNWTKADGTTLGYDNVSNTSGDSINLQMVLDSAGKPNIVWQDGTTGGGADIYFSKWSGAAWVKADGATAGYDNISDNASASIRPQIQLDSTDKPHIIWSDNVGDYDVYFSRWNGTAWVKADGTTAGYDNVSDNGGTSASPYVKIQIDSTNKPYIVWPDNTSGNYELYFSKRNSTANLYVYDQTASQTGWSGQNSGGSTRYTSGTLGTYTISSALSSCVTYYWRSFAKDPLGLNSWSSASSTNTFTTTGCVPPNTAPAATVPNTISQSTDGLGRITFQTAISDADSNNTKLKVEYSDDNGTTWYDAQIASVSVSAGTVDLTNSNAYQIGTSDAIDTSTGSKTLTIVWDAKSASNGNGVLAGDQTDIKVRVTPNDSTVDGTAQASSAFEVDNLNPNGLGSLSFSGVTTDQISASWSQAAEANFQRYRLYYGTSQSDVENQTSSYYQSTSISTTQTTLTGLTSATTYYFKLFATDVYGNSSSTSTASQATLTPSVVIPPPPAPPPAPEPAPEVPPEEVPAEEEPEERPKPSAPIITSISEGETVNQNTFTLQGVAPANSTVIMILDNQSIVQTTANSSGIFTFFLFNLTDGSHTLRLQTKDAAGNVSDAAYFTFRVDVPRELEKTEEEQKIYPEAAPTEVPPAGGEIPGVSGEAGGAGGPSIPITPSPIEEEKEAITPPTEERLLPQVVQTITQTITEAPKAVIKTVAKIQESIPKPHQKWEEQTPIEKTVNVAAQTVVTAGAATGVALSTGLVTLNVGRLAVTFADVNLMLIRAFTTLLSVAGVRRRKSKPWGTVYDSQTKQPLDPAYVQLLDEKGNELETQITDLEGRFGFFIKQSGTYSILANKTNYKFPSERLKGKSGDELYDNLYFGMPVALSEGQILNISVPMDSEKFDWNEFAKKEQGYVKVNPRTEILKRKFSKYAFYSGLVFTPVSYLFSPSKFNLFIVGIYFLIFALRMFNIKEKQYGMAYNKQTGQPFSFAAVRAVYPEIDKTVKSVVADKFGRYYLIVPNGKYYLRVEQKNPDGSYSLIHQTAPFDVKKGIITSDVEA